MVTKDRARQAFDGSELAVVLSHYELGVVESVTPFERGSRRSPKVGIVSARGKFVLKRRDVEHSDLARIRFAHALQAHLRDTGFPLPALSRCVDTGETLLTVREHLYELFDFVPGHAYRGTNAQTVDAGATLARFHLQTEGFTCADQPPSGTYHDALAVRTGLNSIPSRLAAHASVSGREAELLGVAQALFDAYDRAAERAEAAGQEDAPTTVSHSDWHPGNMLFRRDCVAAVIDYDSVRFAPPILDVANGMLQFSMAVEARPERWPDHLDGDRLRGFLAGYQAVRELSPSEKRSIVPLMIEALIAESAVPIAATGSFGQLQGFGFLRIVRRKVRWLTEHAEELTDLFLETAPSSNQRSVPADEPAPSEHPRSLPFDDDRR